MIATRLVPKPLWILGVILALGTASTDAVLAAGLRAGAAKVDVTDARGPVNDPLYAKALVLSDGATTVAVITVDVVALEQIGPIPKGYLATVRSQLEKELHLPPDRVLINASHCHGVVCRDVAERTVLAVKEAMRNLAPVRVGVGVGHENRIMENRRLRLTGGGEADVRHAYSLPPDEAVAGIGPVDPQIGILRLDRENGKPLALVYSFACHPIQGVPSGANTADMTGLASKVIEDSLGDGAVALFLQGCAGDINPVGYKDAAHPRDAEPLGNLLGLSVMKASRSIQSQDPGTLKWLHEVLELPRAQLAGRIATLEAQRAKLLDSLQGTSLDFKTFLPLVVKYDLSGEFPSGPSHRYLHERAIGRDDLAKLDANNRREMKKYLANIHVTEELTRLRANLDLLKMHQAQNLAAGKATLEVEMVGLRVGEFFLVSFPGELSVQIGLDIKKRSPHKFTFIAGYSNGYIYYTPTAQQLQNTAWAQEDCDCLVAPAWQKLFETKVARMLDQL